MVVDRGDQLAWYNGPTLLQILETAPIGCQATRASFRFPVQYVARPAATRTRLSRPRRIRLDRRRRRGDGAAVGPHHDVREIRSSIRCAARAPARRRDAELADEIDVSRGDMIVSAADAPERRGRFRATLCWLDERPLDRRRTYVLRHTTREVRARVDRLDHLWNVSTQEAEPAPDALAMNDIGQATITLAQPIAADRYDDNRATGSFILIDEATNGTVAAGMIR